MPHAEFANPAPTSGRDTRAPQRRPGGLPAVLASLCHPQASGAAGANRAPGLARILAGATSHARKSG
jgi:hypothetical protein